MDMFSISGKKYNSIIAVSALIIIASIAIFFQINDKEMTAQINAIAEAMEESDLDFFPNKPGKIEGIIYGGGPAPGIQIPGQFETKVEKESDGSYIVTFTESWNSEDFHYGEENDHVLSHYFKFRVSPDGVEKIKEGGDFPPQAVK